MRPKRLEFAVQVDRAGRILAETGGPLDVPAAYSAEHLVLAGLGRCTLASLEYHARRASLELVVGRVSASGVVTRRDEDGRYAFVEVECRLDVRLEPAPTGDELQALLEKTERDCFVGASLTAAPRYAWRVNGEDLR